ncbi:hypothetical protein BC938DRAFT_472767 [Jimgerdemannia flammicorona]|uniref:Uncharacterized protein n=1 Tax=Jimgerdemannia flammicorona TaxID=994334 RepID=A0A433Q5F0_9FUNG|nr:hypothetical protein BC938DRAFT_472767 [Jimgerdemannia flammicorona]
MTLCIRVNKSDRVFLVTAHGLRHVVAAASPYRLFRESCHRSPFSLSARQWADLTSQLFDREDKDLSDELCELLLQQIFATAFPSPLLDSYLKAAVTPTAATPSPLIPVTTFLIHLSQHTQDPSSTSPNHWTTLLPLLETATTALDVPAPRDDATTTAPRQAQERQRSLDALSRTCAALSRLTAAGLFPDARPTRAQGGAQPSLSQPGGSTSSPSVLNMSLGTPSQSLDLDAPLDFDMHMLDTDAAGGVGDADEHGGQTDGVQAMLSVVGVGSDGAEADDEDRVARETNAIKAAGLLVDLVQRKKVVELFAAEGGEGHAGMLFCNCGGSIPSSLFHTSTEPWQTCYHILFPSTVSASGSHGLQQQPVVQQALLLVRRLVDRDTENRMAIHMRYQELEDEGTARAMPSAGVVVLMYHLVGIRIRPVLSDDEAVERLAKLQQIKKIHHHLTLHSDAQPSPHFSKPPQQGSSDEAFYLELWMSALTGLVETLYRSHRRAKQRRAAAWAGSEVAAEPPPPVNTTTDQMLWRALVLVKLPLLIGKLEQHKRSRGQRRYGHGHDVGAGVAGGEFLKLGLGDGSDELQVNKQVVMILYSI